MVTLEKLLWIDEEFPDKEALPDVFGDRFLHNNNALFSKIRSLFLSYGFRYSSEPTRLWRDYNSMSLLMLQDMINSGVVPFRDNAVTLRRILQNNAALEVESNVLCTMLQRNYLLHESAHCVSHQLLMSRFSTSHALIGKEEYVLLSIICEAYANTVERLALALVDSEVHSLFFTLNSYLEYRPDVCTLVRDAVRTLGLTQMFTAGMLVFFYLNSHDENPSDPVASIICDIALAEHNQTDARHSLLKAAINHGFGLSRKFRTETTPLYFRYTGCEQEYRQLCTREFDVDRLSSSGILDSIRTLSDLTLPPKVLSNVAVSPNGHPVLAG